MDNCVLEVKNLKKCFISEKTFFGKVKKSLKAVDDISFSLQKGKTLAIVGESGCGKSTLVKTIIGLHKQDYGEIFINGKNKNDFKRKDLAKVMQMIFQDPYSSLNPNMKIKEIMADGMKEHNIVKEQDLEKEILRLLKLCGINENILDKYPSEFSGGQRQRIAIARAISLNPSLIIADEAVSSLDVSMQAQILNLLIDIQREKNLTYIFITHDLSLVKYIASDIAVMYLGKIVEIGSKEEIFKSPMHPYTKLLLNSIPVSHPKFRKDKQLVIEDTTSFTNNINGCVFSVRCPFVTDTCKEDKIEFKSISQSHFVACNNLKS